MNGIYTSVGLAILATASLFFAVFYPQYAEKRRARLRWRRLRHLQAANRHGKHAH